MRSLCRRCFAPAAAGLGCAVGAAGDPAQGPVAPAGPDKSGFTIFNPTPRELLRPISPDRPDQTESPYTVDAGAVQIEMSAVEWTYDDGDGAGSQRGFAFAPFNLKVGVLNELDVQFVFAPYLHQEGGGETAEGVGGLEVRSKINLLGNDSGPVAVALLPFVSFPTGDDDVASDRVEGGIIVPAAFDLGGEWSLGLQIEFDFVRNEADSDYETQFGHTAVLSRPIWGDLSGYVEYVGFMTLDSKVDYRPFVSAGLTYAIGSDVVVDFGAVAALNGRGEDVLLFGGVTIRF